MGLLSKAHPSQHEIEREEGQDIWVPWRWEVPGLAQWATDLGGCDSLMEFTNQEYYWAVHTRGFHGSGEGPGSCPVYKQHGLSDK